jgi:hypothetical protein
METVDGTVSGSDEASEPTDAVEALGEAPVGGVPSLKSLCLAALLRDTRNSIEKCVVSYSRLAGIGEFESETQQMLERIRDHMAYLHERYDPEDLVKILGQEEFQRQQCRIKEMEAAKRNFTYMTHGSVLEREPVVTVKLSQDGYYPYEVLVAGVKWPEGVDPTSRERYLSDDDFYTVFKIPKVKFEALDKHKKLRLKKDVNLF